MKAIPLTRADVADFIQEHHRHHAPTQGDKYRIGCEVNGVLVGVIQVGRPVNRTLDDGTILEVTRLCTDGMANACSFLYSRAVKVAKELGYSKIITYIMDSETGVSLRASGWYKEADTKGKPWNNGSRRRSTTTPICDKQRWSKELN